MANMKGGVDIGRLGSPAGACALLLWLCPVVSEGGPPLYATWTSGYARALSAENRLEDLADDGSNAVYVLCTTADAAGARNATVFKKDREGVLLWEATLTNDADVVSATGKSIDARDGAVALCAELVLGDGGTNMLTALLGDDGSPRWTRRYDPTNTLPIAARVVRVLASGRVAVAGSVGRQAFVAVYEHNGTLLWNAESSFTEPSSSMSTNVCIALEVDDDGQVYTLNRVRFWRGVAWEKRSFLAYSPTGSVRWSAFPSFTAFCVGPSGGVYAAVGGSLATCMLYDQAGVQQWTNSYGLGINHFQQTTDPRLLLPAPDGDGVFCAGQYFNGKQWRYSAARFDAAGTRRWEYIDRPHELNGSFQLVNDAALDPGGNLFLAGNTSLFVIDPAGQKLVEMNPASAEISALGPADVLCALNGTATNGPEVRVVRVTRFPAYSPELFASYDLAPGGSSCADLRITVPSTNGLPLSITWCTNLREGVWTPLGGLWHGTSVITTLVVSNPLAGGSYRIVAEPAGPGG